VQGVEKRAQDQVGRPDHGGRGDEEATRDTTDREADELGGHDDHPLVREVVALAIEHALHSDDVRSVRRLVADASHDSDEHVLLDSEGTRVDRNAEDLDAGHHLGPGATNRVREQLGDEATDRDGRVPEEEELVEAGDDDRWKVSFSNVNCKSSKRLLTERNADNPSAQGAAGHIGVVGVGDGRTDLRVGRVVLEGRHILAGVRVLRVSVRHLALVDIQIRTSKSATGRAWSWLLMPFSSTMLPLDLRSATAADMAREGSGGERSEREPTDRCGLLVRPSVLRQES
jgi:hypothetical protein